MSSRESVFDRYITAGRRYLARRSLSQADRHTGRRRFGSAAPALFKSSLVPWKASRNATSASVNSSHVSRSQRSVGISAGRLGQPLASTPSGIGDNRGWRRSDSESKRFAYRRLPPGARSPATAVRSMEGIRRGHLAELMLARSGLGHRASEALPSPSGVRKGRARSTRSDAGLACVERVQLALRDLGRLRAITERLAEGGL
jgi:hypothetical protein